MIATAAAALLALSGLAGTGAAREGTRLAGEPPAGTKIATFATGCFWCTEADYEKVPGVLEAVSGYMNGTIPHPTYQQVSAGGTDHAEAVRVYYDPAKVTYEQLLDTFWRTNDFLDAGGQFCDRGDQYRSGIFYHDREQKRLAETSKVGLEASGRFDRPIATVIEPAGSFYEAKDYHQGYDEKNAWQYALYRWNCGRDQRPEELHALLPPSS